MAGKRWVLLLVVLGASRPVIADAIYINAEGGRENSISNISISGVSEGRIAFQENQTGRQAQREMSSVTRIELDDEPALARAEAAYVQRKWPEASGAYRETVEITRRPWLKAWAAPRLIESAENSRDLPGAVAGYLALVRSNPTRAEAFTPSVPDQDQQALATAVADVSAALADQNLTPQQRGCLNAFLLDIHRARKDESSAEALLDQMIKSGDAGAARAVVRRKLDVAARLIEQKQWQAAVNQINESRQIFIEQRDQAEALYYLAEAASGVASESGGSDVTRWKDAALAYMRIVAHFKDAPGTPFVAAALLKTAAIEERLNQPDAAKQLYQQVAAQFDDTPAAASARTGLSRLGGAGAAK